MPTVLDDVNGSRDSTFDLSSRNGTLIGKKTKKRRMYVLSDTLNQTEEDIITTPGVPQHFDEERGAVVKTVQAKENTRVIHPVTQNPCILYIVEISYDSDVDTDQDTGGPTGNQNPLRTPRKISWGGDIVEEAAYKDEVTNKPITNVVGERLPAVRSVCLPILTVQRYERYPFPPMRILRYVNHLNSSTFYGAPRGCALMLPIQADEEMINKRKYMNVTYRIQFRIELTVIPGDPTFHIDPRTTFAQDTWHLRLLNEGTKYFTDAQVGTFPWNNPDQVATDDNENPIVINLRANGQKLGAGETPVFLKYAGNPYADFNDLRLGP